MAQTINLELTPYEALEFIKWKSKMVDAVNTPFNDSLKITTTLNRMDNQIQVQFYKDFTVGTFKESHIEELTTIINNHK